MILRVFEWELLAVRLERVKLTSVWVAAGDDFPPRGENRIKAAKAIWWYLTGTVKTD